jgi:hypothetical protein
VYSPPGSPSIPCGDNTAVTFVTAIGGEERLQLASQRRLAPALLRETPFALRRFEAD